MQLTRHQTTNGSRWALDGQFLPPHINLGVLLSLPQSVMTELLNTLPKGESAEGVLLPPVEETQEVWASGVTYLRSREAREAESDTGDVYQKVYNADRPELFFKALGWRAKGTGMTARIRKDSQWNVPEPELTLVINSELEIVGYTAGNDVSSRDIEGENPLYLPQAKSYNGSCAVGPAIELTSVDSLKDIAIQVIITRGGDTVFSGETSSAQMKRTLEDLAAYLGREMDFPQGVLLMTGTGIVPPDEFSLQVGDGVRVTVGNLTLENTIDS